MTEKIKALNAWADKMEARLFAKRMLGVALYWWVVIPGIIVIIGGIAIIELMKNS